eukprot:14019194-Alexandrium_andersonii.AAC.1
MLSQVLRVLAPSALRVAPRCRCSRVLAMLSCGRDVVAWPAVSARAGDRPPSWNSQCEASS